MEDRGPFSPAHAWLIEMGFKLTYYEESWEEGGDAESGPSLEGGPAYDEYDDGAGLRLYFNDDGSFGAAEEYDAAEEARRYEEEKEYWAMLSAKTGKSVAELEADYEERGNR